MLPAGPVTRIFSPESMAVPFVRALERGGWAAGAYRRRREGGGPFGQGAAAGAAVATSGAGGGTSWRRAQSRAIAIRSVVLGWVANSPYSSGGGSRSERFE